MILSHTQIACVHVSDFISTHRHFIFCGIYQLSVHLGLFHESTAIESYPISILWRKQQKAIPANWNFTCRMTIVCSHFAYWCTMYSVHTFPSTENAFLRCWLHLVYCYLSLLQLKKVYARQIIGLYCTLPTAWNLIWLEALQCVGIFRYKHEHGLRVFGWCGYVNGYVNVIVVQKEL